MNRYRFLDIFQENPDGSLSPKRVINVNGITFGPGVSFGQGVSFGGIDFHRFKYLDVAADEQNGTLIINGFFKQ